jgi:hypothetical protein
MLPGLLELRPDGIIASAEFLQCHIEFEYLLQQFGRNVIRALFTDFESVLPENILRAPDRIAQRSVSVIEDRRRFQGMLLLAGGFLAVAIGMEFAAEFVEPALESLRVQRQPLVETEEMIKPGRRWL